jgi:fatty-acyl-CoA synthase
VAAVVALRADRTLTLDELTVYARDGLAGYKLPRRLILVDEVPRAVNGKPDYSRARELSLEAVA